MPKIFAIFAMNPDSGEDPSEAASGDEESAGTAAHKEDDVGAATYEKVAGELTPKGKAPLYLKKKSFEGPAGISHPGVVAGKTLRRGLEEGRA